MKRLSILFIFIMLISSYSLYAADRVSLGFLYGSSEQLELVERTNGAINQVSPTWFDLNSNGNLEISSDFDVEFIKQMKDKNVKVTPFLSNHWNRSKGRAAIENAENLAQQISEVIIEYDLDGVNVDIENLTSKDRDGLSNFVKILREELPKDKLLTVSVAANPYGIDTSWQGSYDYATLGEFVDYLFIMSYDEHSQGGSCGPVASINFVENSIKYALENVSKDKIVLGIPLYGRFWGGDGTREGEAVVIGDIPRLISRFKGIVQYDKNVQQPCVKFKIDENVVSTKVNGKTLAAGEYTIWYENKESIISKLDLVNKYDLLGAGVWALGQEKVDVWEYYYDKLNEIPYKNEEIIRKEEKYKSFKNAKEVETVSIKVKVRIGLRTDILAILKDNNKLRVMEVIPQKMKMEYIRIKERLAINNEKIVENLSRLSKKNYLARR